MNWQRHQRPEFVLFDWDNTLVDTWPVILDCYNAVFANFGMPSWSLERVKAEAHGSLRDLFPTLFGSRSEEAKSIFYGTFNRIHLERLHPKPGAFDLLAFLRASAIRTAVVSNKVGDNLRIEAKHLGWDPFFHSVIGATDAERDKPAPDPIHLALDGSGIQTTTSIWMVGDTRADLLCAHAAGCLPVLLRDESPGDGEFADCPPAIYVPDCHALLALLSAQSHLY